MLYHMITGKELTINDLWQKNGIRETDIIESERTDFPALF